jgi:adenylate cyclase
MPADDVQITPLVEPDVGVGAMRSPGTVQGSEQQVVIMFVDMRGSTQMGEKHLPYDVLFILNRFFSEMTEALDETHGHYAQFTGDGLMALYGLTRGLEQGCRDALEGAVKMQARVDKMNEHFSRELDQPLRIGIGINCGDAIVGTMGPPTSPNFTAIGDSVNAAARLEALSKDFNCVLVVSAEVAELARVETGQWPVHSVVVRGKSESMRVFAIAEPLTLY